jgi:hypothetical protein
VTARGESAASSDILSCYKVKGPGFAADSPRAVTDSFGSINVNVKKKTFVHCVPGTGA